MTDNEKEVVEEVAQVGVALLPPELRVLASLLIKLGMEAPAIVALLKQHGVTDEQIEDADIQNEIDVYKKIAETQKK